THSIGRFKIDYHGPLDGLRAGTYTVTDPYYINEPIANDGEFYSDIFRGDAHSYATDENTEGTITILKFDRKAKIISGTFEFPMFNKKTGERIEVTEGRFDLKIE